MWPSGQDAAVPTPDALAAFAVLAFAIIVIPGPSVMFVVSRALAYGRRAAVLTVLGNAAGFYVQALSVAVGVGALLERSVLAYNTLKVVGAVYLVWLGIQTFRRRGELARVVDATQIRPHRSILLDGFVVGISNPKTIVFFAAVLPQYVRADAAPAALQMAVLGLVFTAVAWHPTACGRSRPAPCGPGSRGRHDDSNALVEQAGSPSLRSAYAWRSAAATDQGKRAAIHAATASIASGRCPSR